MAAKAKLRKLLGTELNHRNMLVAINECVQFFIYLCAKRLTCWSVIKSKLIDVFHSFSVVCGERRRVLLMGKWMCDMNAMLKTTKIRTMIVTRSLTHSQAH